MQWGVPPGSPSCKASLASLVPGRGKQRGTYFPVLAGLLPCVVCVQGGSGLTSLFVCAVGSSPGSPSCKASLASLVPGRGKQRGTYFPVHDHKRFRLYRHITTLMLVVGFLFASLLTCNFAIDLVGVVCFCFVRLCVFCCCFLVDLFSCCFFVLFGVWLFGLRLWIFF